jgi:uncharacterized protein (DUF1015 family)
LDRLILKQMLGVVSGEEPSRIAYTKDPNEARLAVLRRRAQAAFLPGPPALQGIWEIARGGETMPQKSTYFLPKLITGLVMNPVGLNP